MTSIYADQCALGLDSVGTFDVIIKLLSGNGGGGCRAVHEFELKTALVGLIEEKT